MPINGLEYLPYLILAKGDTLGRVAIIFGGEESGLSNDEMKLCDIVTKFPMRRKYPSLNLGQAVMVYATYLSKLNFTAARKKARRPNQNGLSVVRRKAEQILRDVEMKKDGLFAFALWKDL